MSKTFQELSTRLPEGCVKYRITFRGTGNPDDDHEIRGIEFLDKNNRMLFSIGHTELPEFSVEEGK
jgi:hypothetical protein